MSKQKNIISIFFAFTVTLCGFIPVAYSQTNPDKSYIEYGINQIPPSPVFYNTHQNDEAKISTKEEIVSVRFVWNAPVNIAAFERNGKIWLVFDKPNRLDINTLKSEAKHMAKEIYILPHPVGTIVVIEPAPNVQYSLRKEGLLWVVDLFTGRPPKFTNKNLTFFTQYDSMKNSYLFIPTDKSGNVLSMLDPEIGDIMSIITTSELGLGFNSSYRYPDFDILPTMQGLAFVINTPDIAINRGNSGITMKAIGRSLNISGDLDAQKRSQKSKNIEDEKNQINAFGLDVNKSLLEKNLIDAVDGLKKQILSSPNDQKNNIRLKLVQYYIYNGLGTNAVYILNQMRKANIAESKTERFHALSGMANFLARRYKEAIKDFSYGNISSSTEGLFWKTIAQSASEYKEEYNSTIFTHIGIIKDYPQAIKDEVAIIATRNAIATGDDLSSQNFIDILVSVPDRFKDLSPQITYLTAQKLEMQGYIRNAIKEYQSLLNSSSLMFSAYARLNHTILSQMVEFISTKDAIKELEKLRFAWGEREFKLRLLQKLAEFYLKDKDYYNALRVYSEEYEMLPEKRQQNIIIKMIKIFEDIFLGNLADENMSSVKSIALYNDFKWLSHKSKNHYLMTLKLADRLVAVDLLDRAKEVLQTMMLDENITTETRARVGSRLAVIALFENNPAEALSYLERTEAPDLLPETINPRRILYSRIQNSLGNHEKALALLENDNSKNAVLYKFEIYWNAKDWDKASNTIKQLIKEPVAGEKLSTEQINYILDWALALKQAGKATVLVRLRNKFAPFFKNTPYESSFNVLTNNLEKEKIDIKSIRSIINDIKNFNDFAKFYTQQLEESQEQTNE